MPKHCWVSNKTEEFFMNQKKELLDSIFNKLEEKIKIDTEKTDFVSRVNRIFSYLQKNNAKLYNKIIKEYNNPNAEINSLMKAVFEIVRNAIPYTNSIDKYIYIYESQEIVDALDILYKYIFGGKFENVFLFSSSNDFVILNNEYVSSELFKAKYINMIEISNNDVAKVRKYLDLPNEDIAHLNNKKFITGILYTDTCEFNYYTEKNNKENEL